MDARRSTTIDEKPLVTCAEGLAFASHMVLQRQLYQEARAYPGDFAAVDLTLGLVGALTVLIPLEIADSEGADRKAVLGDLLNRLRMAEAGLLRVASIP